MRALLPLGALAIAACVTARPAPQAQAPPKSPTQVAAILAHDAQHTSPMGVRTAHYRLLDQIATLREAVHNDRSLLGREEGEALRRLEGLAQDLELADRPLRESDLYRGGGQLARLTQTAIKAYADREDSRALLFAQAALGEDPGNGARRALLKSLAQRTGIEPDPEGILPLGALIAHELRRAEAAFFDRRFGAAISACRRALVLEPDNPKALTRLGSAHYALGEVTQARAAYDRVLRLKPGDQGFKDEILSLYKERGWTEQQ